MGFLRVESALKAKAAGAPQLSLPRLLVTTDIGGDPDDIQAMVRLLAYSNEFEIVGLIATEAQPSVNPNVIVDLINVYATVRNNLVTHGGDGYPEASDLTPLVKSGSTAFANDPAVNQIGIGNDTEGSNHIIAAVDASAEITNISIWGGQGDFGQALFDAKRLKTTTQWQAFVAKLRVYAIDDQNAGLSVWLRTEFPELWYVESRRVESWSTFLSLHRGMYQNDATGDTGDPRQLVETAFLGLNNTAWLRANVSQNHGALGAAYPDTVVQNFTSTNNTAGVKEGDTPAWFYFLLNGMQDQEQPTWGGWGGRFEKRAGTPQHYYDAEDTIVWRSGTPPSSIASTRRKWTVARWREAYQLDFQARMDWCFQSTLAGANHHPIAVLNGNTTKAILFTTAAAGSTVSLSAVGSSDPDSNVPPQGNALSYRWSQYPEAGSYAGTVAISNSTSQSASFVAPSVGSDQTIHIILEVRDNGTPNLTSYRRLIVTVNPPPPQTLFEEQWDGTNGAAWNATRWPTIATGGVGGTSTVNIQSNQGQLNPKGDSGSFHWARALAASGTLGNINLTVQFTLSTTGEQYHSVTFRHSNGWASDIVGGSDNPIHPQDGYTAMVETSSGGVSNLRFFPVVAGIPGSSPVAAKNWLTGTWTLRIQAIGSAIKLKAWQGAEPPGWDIEVINASHAAGIVGMTAQNGNATTARPISWDNLVITTA